MGRPSVSLEEFLRRANKIHNEFKQRGYDYSKVRYVRMDEKVIIVCPKHGEFKQKVSNHLIGHGCYRCAISRKPTTIEVIERLKKCFNKYGGGYDYEKTHYVNSKTVITVTCAKHGDFSRTLQAHERSTGCPKCVKERMK